MTIIWAAQIRAGFDDGQRFTFRVLRESRWASPQEARSWVERHLPELCSLPTAAADAQLYGVVVPGSTSVAWAPGGEPVQSVWLDEDAAEFGSLAGNGSHVIW